MRCTGNEDLHTPAMDRLAAEGVRFEKAYCTYPLCTPSRASIFAGHNHSHPGVPFMVPGGSVSAVCIISQKKSPVLCKCRGL